MRHAMRSLSSGSKPIRPGYQRVSNAVIWLRLAIHVLKDSLLMIPMLECSWFSAQIDLCPKLTPLMRLYTRNTGFQSIL